MAISFRQDPGRAGGRVCMAVLPLAVVATTVWLSRGPILTAVGRMLIAEDPLRPAEMIVVSTADPAADALEAARLYRQGLSAAIVLPQWIAEPLDGELQRLQVPHLRTTELAMAVLVQSGVPRRAVRRLSTPVDGTLAEIAAVAAYVRAAQPHTVLFITARSHTARARWLLRRELPAQIQVIVRSPQSDLFAADTWWQTREYTREVAMEYLRWVNTFVLHDPWNHARRGQVWASRIARS
jgi:uncharacterized SAM-binding protein YcdF (DUF218 family)